MILNRKRESLSPSDSDIFRKMETLHDSYFGKEEAPLSFRKEKPRAFRREPCHPLRQRGAQHTASLLGGQPNPGVQHGRGHSVENTSFYWSSHCYCYPFICDVNDIVLERIISFTLSTSQEDRG